MDRRGARPESSHAGPAKGAGAAADPGDGREMVFVRLDLSILGTLVPGIPKTKGECAGPAGCAKVSL